MYKDVYKEWTEKVRDGALRAELASVAGDEKEIENRFYRELQFGTGGLRGIVGAGTNCMNIYTVGKATQGVADYVKGSGGDTAVISYDSRIGSDVFARCAACVFAANGIRVHLVRELMPTPFLSFAVRYFHAAVGVMITASHNPAKYNGYKVYGGDGCQITDHAAAAITDSIGRVDCFSVDPEPFERYVERGMIAFIGEEVEEAFLRAVSERSVCAEDGLRVVYTPLNGTGYRIVPKMLARIGVQDVRLVREQATPDGNFPTCPYPNPEKPEAMALGLQYAAEAEADLLLATDPDADRVGIAVRDGAEYRLMSGNEVGVLLMDFLLSVRKAEGTLPKVPVVIKTIVTTRLAERVAQAYGVTLVNVLTGFKYIGEQIGKLERAGRAQDFVLGFEESYGYLAGSYVRDKDAVGACMLIAEMASCYKKQGKTLAQRMREIYAQYGTYAHKLLTYSFPGAEGAERMRRLLAAVRKESPRQLAELPVLQTTDYLTQTDFDLPKSDVLQYDLAGGAQVILRPSGTEPLIKVYLTVSGDPAENAAKLTALEEAVRGMLAA